jgi:hypothetical protein
MHAHDILYTHISSDLCARPAQEEDNAPKTAIGAAAAAAMVWRRP